MCGVIENHVNVQLLRGLRLSLDQQCRSAAKLLLQVNLRICTYWTCYPHLVLNAFADPTHKAPWSNQYRTSLVCLPLL